MTTTSAKVTSVLCLHGLTSSPDEFSDLCADLEARGIACFNPRLPGHSGDIEELRRTPLSSFLSFARESMEPLTESIAIVGSSFGAVLGYYLMTVNPGAVSKLVLLSPPWQFRTRKNHLLASSLAMLPDSFLNLLATKKKHIRPEGALLRSPFTYSEHALGSVARMWKIIRSLTPTRQTECDALVLVDPTDHHLADSAAFKIFSRLNTRTVRLKLFPQGQHELLCGPKHEEVAKTISDFITVSE